jgi:hypothetical protein
MNEVECVARSSNHLRNSSRALLKRFSRNERGATAIEFAMVLGPFLIFVFGIFALGLHYLATNSIERAVFSASRAIRTGQAQKAAMTADQFKAAVCQEAAPYIDCNMLKVHIQNKDSWDQITPVNCIDNKQMAGSGSGSDMIGDRAGGASKIVLVTACYEWTTAKYIPYLMKDEKGEWRRDPPLESGNMVLQSATVFRTEPYE